VRDALSILISHFQNNGTPLDIELKKKRLCVSLMAMRDVFSVFFQAPKSIILLMKKQTCHSISAKNLYPQPELKKKCIFCV